MAYSMGGLSIGGGFLNYDPYEPFIIEGREFGDYYDPYGDITRGLPGKGGAGPLGYGASIEEVRGDIYGGRPIGAYDEYDLNHASDPWSGGYGWYGWW